VRYARIVYVHWSSFHSDLLTCVLAPQVKRVRERGSWVRMVGYRMEEIREALASEEAAALGGMPRAEDVEHFLATYLEAQGQGQRPALEPLDRFAVHLFSLTGQGGQGLEDDDPFVGWCEIAAYQGLDVRGSEDLLRSFLARLGLDCRAHQLVVAGVLYGIVQKVGCVHNG
jgi:hypothetical protein